MLQIHKRARLALVLTLFSLVLAACGSDNTPVPAATTSAAAATTGSAATTVAAVSTTAASASTGAATTVAGSTTTSVATTAAGTATTAAVAAGPRGQTLTVAVASFPASLDPGTGDPVNEPFLTPAYDSLLRFDADGNYQPMLATSWKWVGTDFKTFELQLRPNVKFSDGSTFDANAVKSWLELQKTNKTVTASNIGLDTAEVTGPLTIQLHLAQPNSLLPTFLTRNWISGIIACPAAVTNADLVKTATCGIGPYTLDTKNTVSGDTYTYLPNPNYWNQDAIHWNKLVMKVVANPQAALDALKTGQVQVVAPADASVVDAAVSAGLKQAGVDLNVQGLDFLYKDGTLTPALKDTRVRQALNYAIDREALSKLLAGGKGRPISTQFLPGSDGYDASLDNYYTYDVAKAKQLLSDAGFANGFEVSILSAPFLGFDTLAQAVSAYWQAIGVKTTIDSKASLAEFVGGLSGGKYATAVAGLGAVSPTLITWNCCMKPGATWNPDKTAVPELQALIDKLGATDATNMPATAKQVNKYLTEQAWYLPVIATKLYFLYDPHVTGVTPTATEPVINLMDIKPAA